MKKRTALLIVLPLVLTLMVFSIAGAQSSSKSFSTNFTLINFDAEEATVSADYILDDGSTWSGVAADSLSFTVDGDGGQKIFRQYAEDNMAAGKGSVVISSDRELAAVVQMQARAPQVPSFGAYSGFSSGSSDFYIPLVSRRGSSADGLTNSQIIIQNTGSSAVDVEVTFRSLSDGSVVHTESLSDIPAGASRYYDLDTEGDLPTAFFGSAAVSALDGGEVAVVSNFFIGNDTVQTFNAFSADDIGTSFVAPLITARLANGLSAPITIQNLSGGDFAANSVDLDCVGDAGFSDFSIQNTSAVVDGGSYVWNPVAGTHKDDFPDEWVGACKVTAPGDIVMFVQLRFVGTPLAAAYEGINAAGTGTTVSVPLVAKRLANNFATAITIVNLSDTDTADVSLVYKDSTDGSLTTITSSIDPGASLIQNHRTPNGVAELDDGYVGSLTVTSTNDVPIAGFAQLTIVGSTSGDTFMAHNAFSR